MTDPQSPPGARQTTASGLSYHSPDYWNNRFSTDPRETHGFEWLSSTSSLVNLIPPSLLLRTPPTRILHIGVGTSKLSLDLVRILRERSPEDWKVRAKSIVNVDFSPKSIDFQRHAEKRFLEEIGESEEELMEYYVLDLLNWAQVKATLGRGWFDVVLDKSTTDSISTGQDTRFTTITQSPSTYHPSLVQLATQHSAAEKGVAAPQMLGLHLGSILKRDALWLCHSYSSARWEDIIAQAWPWKESQRTPVAVETADPNAPQIRHWIYTLQHT